MKYIYLHFFVHSFDAAYNNVISANFLRNEHLLRLCETQNALQLSVFFLFFSFYYQPYPGLWHRESVFLILKISQCRWVSSNQGGEFSFFQGIYIRIDLRIAIFISIIPMTTKFVKQVHPQELTQTRLIKQVLMTSSRHVIN